MKKIFAILLAALTLLALASCGGGISDVVDSTPRRPGGTTPAVTTPVVTDPVRDSYYAEMDEIRAFENVYLEIDLNGATYVITDEDTASTLLFGITAVDLRRVEKAGNTELTVRVYRDGALERTVHYPYVTVSDPNSGKDVVYHAYISGISAELYVLDILEIDGIID